MKDLREGLLVADAKAQEERQRFYDLITDVGPQGSIAVANQDLRVEMRRLLRHAVKTKAIPWALRVVVDKTLDSEVAVRRPVSTN